jgi:hypothetical protein
VAVQEEALAGLRGQLEESQTQCNTLQQEKNHLEMELHKLKQRAEDLLDDKDEQVKVLEESQRKLEKERDQVQAKNEKYEQEIARQSKRLLELEEEVDRVTDESVRELCNVQQDALDRSQVWNLEKQSMQEEVRRLKEQVAEKELELTRRLEEERRAQTNQLCELEAQVSALTTALAEYRGRHDELRATVDQHIQVGKDAVKVTQHVQTVACQTSDDKGDTENCFEPITLPLGNENSNALPRTPVVRLARKQSSSPPLSHPDIPPNTPWRSDPTEQRQKLSAKRADPPSSLEYLSAHSFATATTNVPRGPHHSLRVLNVMEEPVDSFDHDEDGAPTSRHFPTPQTEKTTNVSRVTFKNRLQKSEKVCDMNRLLVLMCRETTMDSYCALIFFLHIFVYISTRH